MCLWPLKRAWYCHLYIGMDLSSLPTNAAGKLDILGHDGDSLGMDGTQVGVFKETDKVSLGCLLQGHDSWRLEAKVCLEILGNFSHKALEGQLSDQQFSGFLVTTDLTKSYGTRPVTMGFLHSSCSRSWLAGSLGGKLLSWGLPTSRFTGSLLCTSHRDLKNNFKTSRRRPTPPFYTPRQQNLTQANVIGRNPRSHWTLHTPIHPNHRTTMLTLNISINTQNLLRNTQQKHNTKSLKHIPYLPTHIQITKH